MPLLSRHPVVLALLVLGMLSAPATYRGGSAAAHPHMFLQLWHDASTESFTHHVFGNEHTHGHAGHHKATRAEGAPSLIDADQPTVASFVVSDWGFASLLTPQPLFMPLRRPELTSGARVNQTLHGIDNSPETPPPR